MKRKKKIEKYLKIGIFASILTVCLAEMPIGWVVKPDLEDGMMAWVLAAGTLSYGKMMMGVLFGAIGISLQYYGFEAIALFLDSHHCSMHAFLVRIGSRAVAFLGASVHCLCIALMFIIKMEVEREAFVQFPASIVDFSKWILFPLYGLFLLLYVTMCIAWAVAVFQEKTCLPKWAVCINPLMAQLVSPLFLILPNVAFVNGLNMALMGLGSLWTFAGLYLLLRSH